MCPLPKSPDLVVLLAIGELLGHAQIAGLSGRLTSQPERDRLGIAIHIHFPEHSLLFPAILRCDHLLCRVPRQCKGDILRR